ncbi:MAG: PAS domain-containing protein, partial [Candidatus Acidiferrales bacterium]
MEPLLEHPAGEIKRLQRCINDLVSVLALPAIWAGGEPTQIVTTLLDALLGMLRLDFVYARLKVSESEAPIEMVRVAPIRKPAVRPQAIGEALNHLVGDDPQNWPLVAPNPMGDGEIVVMPSRLGMHGEAGIILAASQRADFPEQTERLLLSVAANQAAIGLQEARLLGDQRRVASELDRRVAQRTTELAAANDELRLRVGLLQLIPVAAWTVKPDGRADFVNQRWLDYTGQTIEYIQSHPEAWLAATHPEDREKASSSYWNGIRSGQGFTTETRFRRVQDGTYHWHLNRAVPLRDVDGRIICFVGTSTDIEELKLAQEKLRQSELNLRLMTETIPEMLWSATPRGDIDYCNARLLDYTGVPAEEIIGAGWKKLLHP